MFDKIKNSTLVRNLDINSAVILGIVFVFLQRGEGSNLADGLFWQWVASVLAIGTSVGLGAYSHRKVFYYMRPDQFMPRDENNKIDFEKSTTEQFKKMKECSYHRLIWIGGFVLATVWFLGNSGV